MEDRGDVTDKEKSSKERESEIHEKRETGIAKGEIGKRGEREREERE